MTKLEKVQIANGVYWVAIPDAGLYILCGCPADSVKHLMKRGLILTKEKDGVNYESGPNAILLSDVLVQNGMFSNLPEFPVLQMLYRQGMILPNHPNNTGIKPLLIGAEDQVRAQMQYIYRGNYGLISEEEIQSAGISKEMARIMMRMKLKFAFGKIWQTDELLETCVVNHDPIEIRGGVFIRKLHVNVYEFRYEDTTVTVDMNLTSNEVYGVPYQLSYHEIKREYFAVIHSGEGDGWDINRPCMASILMFQGKIYLIDAGPNILHSLMALGISVNEIEGIFHTHAHDDHFAGLPTLMRADHRIKYYATPLVRRSVAKKLAALVSIEERRFDEYFDVHDLDFDKWNDINGLEVRPIFSPHPVETSIFMFRTLWENGYRSYAHFADIVSLDVLKNMITAEEEEAGISQEFYNQVRDQYLSTVDLKKIDIGGGLIHGMAEDFREDKSQKIILSHTSLELTDQQKEIGSDAPFGMVDVLISANQDYAMQYAFNYLHSYFPTAPRHQIRILLNNHLISFNAGSILLKKGAVNQDIFLILTGNVELIQSESKVRSILSAGSLVGEISGLIGIPLTETYRAASFVKALRLPCNLYLEFVKRNGLYKEIEMLRHSREFLSRTWLFGEAIPYTVQNKLAQVMRCISYKSGENLPIDQLTEIYLVCSGKLEIYINDDIFEILTMNQFFGEEGVLFNTHTVFKVRAVTDSEVYHIPGNVLLDIPIVRWKLLETFEKRMRVLGNYLVSR